MNDKSFLQRLCDHWKEEMEKGLKKGTDSYPGKALLRDYDEIMIIFLESQARAMTRLTDEVIKESREMRKEMET